MEGKGRLYCANGDIYIGDFRHNRREGIGLFYNSSNPGESVKKYFLGEFFGGKQCGYGV